MARKFLAILAFLCIVRMSLAINADPAQYPKIVQFAKENVDPKAQEGFRFWKVTDLSISETQTGKQYHLWLLYLTRDGFQDYFYVTVYENPWGELVIYDISKNGPMDLMAKKRFLQL